MCDYVGLGKLLQGCVVICIEGLAVLQRVSVVALRLYFNLHVHYSCRARVIS